VMHQPVLVNEVLDLLAIKRNGIYIDATVGSGGHFIAILKKIGPKGILLGIDRDKEALKRARQQLSLCIESAVMAKQCFLAHGNYADMADIAESKGIEHVDGVLLDLGVSSEQIDAPERGFSFMKNGPLDMRMDQSAGQTAEELINDISETELIFILRSFGEERQAKRISGFIAKARKKASITTTGQLADIIEKAVGWKHSAGHPAMRTFQALRIAVNSELDLLKSGLSSGLSMLVEGGRLAVISFHSLEDRIVKNFFKAHTGKWESLQSGGREWRVEKPAVLLVNRKPITATKDELKRNTRSRSAKLRVAEKSGGNNYAT